MCAGGRLFAIHDVENPQPQLFFVKPFGVSSAFISHLWLPKKTKGTPQTRWMERDSPYVSEG